MQVWVRNLAGLWLAQFLSVAGFSLVMPFLPIYVKELGITSVSENGIWSGLLFSVTFVTVAAMSPVWGSIGDRYGRKPMLLRAFLGMTVTLALMALVSDVWQLLGLRALLGILGGSVPMVNALVAVSAPRERIGFAMGMLQTAMASGAIIGPLVGGALADAVGIRAVFYVTAGLMLLAGLVAAVAVREDFTPAPRVAGEGFFDGMKTIVGLPQLRVIFLLVFFAQFSAMIIEPIVTLYISTLPSVSPSNLATQAGLIFAAAGISGLIAAPLWGRYGDRTGNYKQIVTLAVFGASLVYFPQALVSSPGQLLVLRSLLGIFNAATGPAIFAIVAALVPRERQGGAFGLTSTPVQLGNVIGPLAGGVLQAAFGIRSVFFVTGALLFVVGVLAYRIIQSPGRGAAVPLAADSRLATAGVSSHGPVIQGPSA